MKDFDSKQVVHYSGGALLVALTVAVIWQMTGPTWFKNIKAEVTSQPYARTITVSAEGKVNAKPDIAMISFSVVTQGTTVKQVTTDNTAKMNAVIDSVKAAGVDAKDIATSQYNLYPTYPDYQAGAVRRITGYNLDQQVTVKIRKLENVDDILDGAIKAGANEVGALSFDIDDTGAVKKQAREKAFTTARQKGEEMAGMAGVKLGRVVTFTESGDYNPPVYANYVMDAKREMAVSNQAASIEPGSKELNLTVSVTYEIE